ncbi:MAG: hypothetical protein GY765_25120, partial [bacterium]|nr:hypothetical protein [bacterium]
GAAKQADKKLREDFEDVLNDKYCFTDQLDKLGQRLNEDNHIAVVHIDGNDMGDFFRELSSLEDIRTQSLAVEEITRKSFKKLLDHIVTNFEDIRETPGYDTPNKKAAYPTGKESDKGRLILPIRSIIIGGDDITFVCPGNLGIYFAKLFLQYFKEEKSGVTGGLSACAGISINKTKYPFHHSYLLAEQLCDNAKAARRKKENGGSWLDFHIAYGGYSGTLEEIRDQHYITGGKNLLFRPYQLDFENENNWFDTFVENTRKLKALFPKSKIMELREELNRYEASSRTFTFAMQARNRELPVLPGESAGDTLWRGDKTPYFDMIELMGFYPLEMETEKGND